MRKADLANNHGGLDEALARYRLFLERIVEAKRVVRTVQEKQDIAESMILRLTANWEKFVDEHIIDCVNVDHSKLSDYLGIVVPAHPSKNLCEGLLFGGTYKDFKSYGDLKGFSKKILPENSNPFLQVHSSRTIKIDELYKIRNYLAHYSATAKRSLKRMYEERYGLANFVEPGRFLLANECTRLWGYFDAIESASQDMKDWY